MGRSREGFLYQLIEQWASNDRETNFLFRGDGDPLTYEDAITIAPNGQPIVAVREFSDFDYTFSCPGSGMPGSKCDPFGFNQAPMFHAFFDAGIWDFDDLSFSSTTFVSASTDRGKVVIGEGGADPTGRILMYHAEESAELSPAEQINDLVNNASEVVLGVSLNHNGTLGVARGQLATYFFTPDLRLQGLFEQDQQGGAGAAFHPDHDSDLDGGHHSEASGDLAGAAFTGTPSHSIEVVNTFHFNKISELFIRDNVVGPLRSGPPLASDNAGNGRTCPNATVTNADDCVMMRLYGITDVGGVVVIAVRQRDLLPE